MRWKNKYKAKRTELAGRSFASKLESSVYQRLLFMEKSGLIYDLKCQVHVYLTKARICMIPDFSYVEKETNELVYSEAKGFPTPEWKIKKRLWAVYGPAKLEIWSGNHKNPFVIETVKPNGDV